MIRPITDEQVRRLVEQAEADRMDRPRNSAAACRISEVRSGSPIASRAC